MTVSSATNKVQYNGNGSTTVFAYTFKVFSQNDLTVIVRSATGTETVKTITTHYTVSGVGSAGGGNVTMLTAPASGETLTILREQDLTQELDLVENDPFPAQSLEDSLDKLTFMVQQHSEEIDRSIKASRTNTITSTEFTVSAASRANKIFAFDSAGELSVTQELGTYRGDWAVATAYFVRDLVKDTLSGNIFIAITAHTSSGTQPITANVDSAKWALLVDNTGSALGLSSSSGSSLVGYNQGSTGAVTRTVQARLRDYESVKDFGAVGDGVADDTAAVQAAFSAASAGETILLPSGSYKISSVNFTGKAINLVGYGATIICTSATGAVYKTDHGNKLQVRGISFTGTSTFRAINHQTTQSTTVNDELEVVDCTFDMAAGIYGIYSVGTREAHIFRCTFLDTTGGSGIYFKDSVSPFVDKCVFKGTGYTARGIYYPGTGTPYDAGLVLRDSEIMGYDKGLEIVGCDWLVIDGCTIDYNNYSIKLGSQDGANISNNYIGSLGANPALWITSDAAASSPDYSDKIIVINNTFTGHYTGGNTYDCILIDGSPTSDNIQISHNNISFFTRYGIQFNMTAKLSIHNNVFNQRSTFGVSPIYCTLGTSDSTVSIKHNFLNNGATIAGLNIAFAQLNENFGIITEGRGQVVVGSGVSTYNIAHGMGYTPATSDCQVVASNAEAATKNVYVSSVDATNLVVGFTTATAANAGVNWRIRRGP